MRQEVSLRIGDFANIYGSDPHVKQIYLNCAKLKIYLVITVFFVPEASK